ncbi:MAG: AsmA family protein, partial [Methylophilus methylotrophus]
MPLQKIKRWLVSFLIVIFVILAGIIGTIQFYVFPHIDDYRGKIEQALSESLKQQVTIAHIAIRWRGLAPQVTLGKVVVFDAEHRPALELSKVTTRLSWSSLATLSPALISLSIDSPNLVVRRTADGELFLAGISMSGQGNPAFANWLLAQRRIKISKATVTWVDEKRQAPPLLLKDLNIQILTPVWQRLLNRHSIHIDSLVSTGTRQRITVEAVVVGSDVAKPEAWHGEISLRLPDTDMAAWSPWLDLPVNVNAGKGNLTTTLAFDALQLQRLAAQVQLKNVAVTPANKSRTFVAKSMSGELRWQRVDQRFMLALKHFSADIQPGVVLEDTNGELQWDSQGHEGVLTAKKFALAQGDLFAEWLPADSAVARYLENMAPAGNASQIKARWLYQQNQWRDYSVAANFNGLHSKAYENIPGLDNLSGQLSLRPNAGSVEFDTSKASIELAGLLRWPLPIDRLQGEVEWRNNGQKTLISTRNLHFSNPHLALRTNLEYQLGATGGDTIQLQSQIERGDAKFASFYYPLILGETTLHWLDTSILSGQIKHGEVIVKGRVQDFPYVNEAHHSDPSIGLFRVTAQVDNASLEYGTDWPVIQNIEALLKFEGKRMDISVKNGSTVGQHITQAQVEIPRLDADWPMLNIKAAATGTLEQGIKFVNTSPVRQVT